MLRRIFKYWMILLVFFRGAVIPSESGIEYRRIVQDNITVFCVDADLNFGRDVLSVLHAEMPRMAQTLEMDSLPSVHVFIAESNRRFHQITASVVPEWGIGAADAGSGFIFLKSPRYADSADRMASVVRHELVHVLIGEITSGYEVPRWLDEGLAQVLSEERSLRFSLRLARSVQAGDVIPLEKIDDVLAFQKTRAALAYETAHSAVEYFIQMYGQQSLNRLLRKLGRGMFLNEAMLASIHQTRGAFESDWEEHLRSNYRWAFVLNFPFLVSLSFVFLFLAAYGLTRRRMAERRRIWESESDDEENTALD